MNNRQRAIVGVLWLAVAGVMATTIEPTVPTTLVEGLRIFVVVMALFLSGLYLLNPWNLITRTHEIRTNE